MKGQGGTSSLIQRHSQPGVQNAVNSSQQFAIVNIDMQLSNQQQKMSNRMQIKNSTNEQQNMNYPHTNNNKKLQSPPPQVQFNVQNQFNYNNYSNTMSKGQPNVQMLVMNNNLGILHSKSPQNKRQKKLSMSSQRPYLQLQQVNQIMQQQANALANQQNQQMLPHEKSTTNLLQEQIPQFESENENLVVSGEFMGAPANPNEEEEIQKTPQPNQEQPEDRKIDSKSVMKYKLRTPVQSQPSQLQIRKVPVSSAKPQLKELIIVKSQGGNGNAQQNNQANQKKGQGNNNVAKGQQTNNQGNDPSQQQQQNNMQNIKQSIIQTIQEIIKPVVQRSEDMNNLKQVIDLKNQRFKPKYTDSSIFFNILQKESQRVNNEVFFLNKIANIRIEDKPMIKKLQKAVKKMLKPFKGLNFDDFLHGEIHLNEIMTSQQDVQQQQLYQMKESRKRHMRILQAALKDTVVDPQVVVSICVQVSRQAFYNELKDYFGCAFDIICNSQGSQANSAQQNQATSNNPLGEFKNYQNLKKLIQKAKLQAKVQIDNSKKLDKMFKVLFEQNSDVLKQITTYKEQYEHKKQQDQQLLILGDHNNGQSRQSLSRLTRNRNSVFIPGRNQSAMQMQNDSSVNGSLMPTQKKTTISAEPGAPESFKKNLQLKPLGCRSGNQTMQNFYATPQGVNKLDQTMITVRLGNQKVIANNSKLLAPLSIKNIASQNTTKATADSLNEASQQKNICIENIDMRNLKKLNQLPSIQHQHQAIQSESNTPHQPKILSKDLSYRGNSVENLLKMLYNSKNKKHLEPLPDGGKSSFDKTQKPLIPNQQTYQYFFNPNNLNSQYFESQQSTLPKRRINKSLSKSDFQELKINQQPRYSVNFDKHPAKMSYLTYSFKDTDPGALPPMSSSSDLQSMTVNNIRSDSKRRVIRTSHHQCRQKFSKMVKQPKNQEQIQRQEYYQQLRYKISEQYEGFLNRYFNKNQIISFMINHYAKKIQWFFKKKLQKKMRAKQVILKYWRLYRSHLAFQQQINSKIFLNSHKRAARVIEKHYIKYKSRQRVGCQRGEWKQHVDYSKIKDFMQKIILIQRWIRKFQYRKYSTHQLIKKEQHQKQSQFNQLRQKYLPQAMLDSKQLFQELQYAQDIQSLDYYFHDQILSFESKLQEYESQLQRAIDINIDKRDWVFNNASREWYNQKLNLTLKNVYNQPINSTHIQQQLIATPAQKLMEINKQRLMPTQSQIMGQIDTLNQVRQTMEQEVIRQRDRERESYRMQIRNSRSESGALQQQYYQEGESPDKTGNYDRSADFQPNQSQSQQNYQEMDLNVYEDDDDETLHRKLIAAKIARKRAEEDFKLLSNRIALLRQEEQKAWKKIDETKKRARDILHQRQRNIENQQTKLERQRQKEEEELLRQAQNRALKEQLKQNIDSTKQGHQEKLKSTAEYVKQEKQQQKDFLNQQKQQEYIKNSSLKQMIRNQQKEAQEKRQRDLMEKQNKTKSYIEEKAIREEQMRLNHEQMVAKMEQEELELIQRLQNTQMLQKAAYEDLENALQNGERPGTQGSRGKSGSKAGLRR